MNELVSSDPLVVAKGRRERGAPVAVELGTFWSSTPPLFVSSMSFGLPGGVEACASERQHDPHALFLVEEAEAGTAASRCI